MQKKEVKAVLFDMDGVLVDSLEAWFYTFNDALKHFGARQMSMEEFAKDFGNPIEKDIEKHYEGQTVKELTKVYDSYFNKRLSLVKLFGNPAEVFSSLKEKGIKIGLITNSTRNIAISVLEHFALKKYFDVIVTMNDVEKRKPAPDMPLKACSFLNVKPHETILVGDTKNDMAAGIAAGCVTVGYKINGVHRINKISELLDILE